MDIELARAKINLTLHVTGQRSDGYHLLDSLTVFADMGDVVHGAISDKESFSVIGPYADDVPLDGDNLVIKGARLMGAQAHIVLEKNIPVASGIGGGSTDAAATLRLLSRLSGRVLPSDKDILALGADVPVCLESSAVRMSGVGEVLTPLPPLPEVWLVLVNPGARVSTPQVFGGVCHKNNAPMPEIPPFHSLSQLVSFLKLQRNDLEDSACRITPLIHDVKTALLAQPECLIARMSGSGATCFGVFASAEKAMNAAGTIKRHKPKWWVVHTQVS